MPFGIDLPDIDIPFIGDDEDEKPKRRRKRKRKPLGRPAPVMSPVPLGPPVPPRIKRKLARQERAERRAAREQGEVWAAEQTLPPWLVPRPTKPAKERKPRTFAEAMGERPLTWRERERQRREFERERLELARATLDPRIREQAQALLATTTTRGRAQQLRERGRTKPKPRGFFDMEWNPTKAEFWDPEPALRTAGHGVKWFASGLGEDINELYEMAFDPGERKALSELLQGATEDSARASHAITEWVLDAAAKSRRRRQAAGIGFLDAPAPVRKAAAASLRSAVEAAVGAAPGTVMSVAHPIRAGEQFIEQERDYYGRLLRGDFSVLEEYGITPAAFDLLAIFGFSGGLIERGGALRATSRELRKGGSLHLSSEDLPMSRTSAYTRAAILGQRPVGILGSDIRTMGVETRTRHIEREAQVERGEAIQAGDRVIVREGEDERVVRASEENGLAGLEAPDVNHSYRHTLDGNEVEVIGATRPEPFAQRMLPRSRFFQMLSDFYWKARTTGKGGREKPVERPSGQTARARLLRQEQEVEVDRQMGAIRGFVADSRKIQRDIVLSTAYDRSLRFPNALKGVEEEIAARRQRGMDETKEQQQVIGALEQAREVLRNPPENLQKTVTLGKELSQTTEDFLIRRGFLTRARADEAKLAAARWLRPGHLLDPPLESPERTLIRDSISQHFDSRELADLAMNYTDTLARAWGVANERNPADWYRENIASVSRKGTPDMEVLAQAGGLTQRRALIPRQGEAFPYRDPQTGDMRVARMIEADIEKGTATIEWVREPNAGMRQQVPLDSVMGNTSKVHGWYSGIANEVEKLPEKFSRQEAESRLRKAPGVKADEWKWMNMDYVLARAFADKKSATRADLVAAMRQNSFSFQTIKLNRDEAVYEHQYDVTLPGPRADYTETLIYWPERADDAPELDGMDIAEAWESEVEYQLGEELIDENEAEAMLREGPDYSWQEDYVTSWEEQYKPLYEAPHFGGNDYGQDYSGNLLAHLRQSDRWMEGTPLRVIEEAQSDWHQAGRRGYSTEEKRLRAEEAERVAKHARKRAEDARQTYLASFVKQLSKSDIHVRNRSSGEEGNIYRDAWGETPYFRIVIEEATPETPRGRSERQHIRDIEPTSDADLRDLYEEYLREDAEAADQEFIARNRHRENSGPPEAPYAGERWEELLFREAVRQAVADGHTRIAFTTGGQQAERYNMLLANNVRRIEYDGDQLQVTDQGGGYHSFDVPDEDKLVEYVGSSLAKKLVQQLGEQPIRHDLFRVDRPVGEGFRTETHMIPVSEMRQGDIVWVGYPSDEPYRRPEQFRVREEGGNRLFLGVPSENWHYHRRFPFKEEGIGGAEFAEIARGVQRDQWENHGESRRDPAVLEGEGISIGGGGFIDAYDRRMRNYAKKYLGTEPRKQALDDLWIEHVPVESEIRPHPWEELTPAERAEVQKVLPLYRIRAGDKVLAESESQQSALQAAYHGGPDAGMWPSRVRYDESLDQWLVVGQGGKAGDVAPSWERVYSAHDTAQEAVNALENGHYDNWIDDFDQGNDVARGAGEVWVADIPEDFAMQLHDRGSPLFQRRQGSVLGLARLTDEGADIFLSADAADMATWVEEAAHAVIPKWFDDADARGDVRANMLRQHIGLDPGAPITAEANEVMVRLMQEWLRNGALPAPQLRTLMDGLSAEMGQAYRSGIRGIAKDADEVKLFQRMLDDPAVTSFLRDQFDVAPYKDFDPGTVAFQTMKRYGRFTRRQGGRLPGMVRSILPSGRKLTKHPNTMRAWESGQYDVGPEVTAHYAAAETRMRVQDEMAKRVLRFAEPIEVKNGVPILKPGYRVYNYYGIRGANDRIDTMFRRSERYGDITDSEEPLISADPGTGSMIDMDPEDFADVVDVTVGKVLSDELIHDDIATARAKYGDDAFMEMLRDGRVKQIPSDVADAFIASSGGAYTLGAVSQGARAIGIILAVPSLMARWRMIGKLAYPILNAAQTAILVGMNQGPLLAVSTRRVFDLSKGTRARLREEVGVGHAELADMPDIVGQSHLARARSWEQQRFRYVMGKASFAEGRIRELQINNDLARAGYRSEKDIVALLDKAKEGHPEARALLNQVGRWAEDAVVRFRGASPFEQLVIRDAIFVYGWLRAATRFTVQFPRNRPVTATALYHIGQYGWEQLQDEFYALPYEQQGAIPTGQHKTADDTIWSLVDVSQFLPFKSGMDLVRPVFSLLGLEDQGLRPASYADLLSPSAEFSLTAVYGEDPLYGTKLKERIWKDYFDARNWPGIYWAARFIDPSLTGTKLREERSRWGVIVNLFAGMATPTDVKASASYAKWLDQRPYEERVLIREQNDAVGLVEQAFQAARARGGSLDQESLRAINADSAYKILSSLREHEIRRRTGDSDKSLTAVQRAAAKALTIQKFYPDLFAQGEETMGSYDLATEEGKGSFVDLWDDYWRDYVSATMTDIRADIRDTLGVEPKESQKVPYRRSTLERVAAEASR